MFKFISNIGIILSMPIRFCKTLFHVPNTRILYKSGNSQKLFLAKIKYTADTTTGSVTELEWQSLTGNNIVYPNVHEIEAIMQLW